MKKKKVFVCEISATLVSSFSRKSNAQLLDSREGQLGVSQGVILGPLFFR